MTDQIAAKRTLQELIKREDLKNKTCVDCGNPNPQWASVSFAIFLCLQCAGVHRGFGVHISFVRSVSMDTWQEEQIRRMKLGGNGPFMDFLQSYSPTEQGGYTPDMSVHDKYHCWAATQYREKLDSDLQGKSWSPSAPPEGYTTPGSSAGSLGRPSSAQGLRKSRASTRGPTGLRTDSHSPASSNPASPKFDQKTANESYFASLGSANASRPENLPPSQGGRYQGFGSTPSPQPGSDNPSYGLSSRSAPSLNEIQENPMAALSKGWSLFSSVVVGASRALNENVIQPGMERVADPEFQAGVRGYVSEASRRAGDLGKTANQWSRNQFGVDVAGQVGGALGGVRDRVGGGPERSGYSSVAQGGYADESSALYQDDEDDFFHEYSGGQGRSGNTAGGSSMAATPAPAGSAKKADDWDEWKEF
ncbi:putative GTPase activating protein for Arf-domain-containing protein [Amylostereum chailletii]|nr:putative GTPase activating protein for Arf-domain-containing protein [Amylostereum chailletii]